ncbi:MAG TPA: hypothetical protein RMH99_08055 [Sandaracinaceae bacterium LLY-WYZ-13_1]|nr:hypothetical protein [Sandaracinaceae bacterium LLY-WYZ-13_1]
MKTPKDGAPVPPERSILRLPTPPPDIEPDDYVSSGAFFVLGSEERDGNGRLSVRDEALTSVAQARGFRDAPDVIVLRGQCADVLEAGATNDKDVQVVYEPPSASIAGKPGADGHAGIVGLRRPKGGNRTEYRALRDAIADCFDLV